MKRNAKFQLFSSVLLTLILVTGCSAGATSENAAEADEGETVQVGVLPNANKISFIGEDDELTGFEVEVLKEIDKRIPEYQFEFQPLDFANLFVALDTSKVDLISGNIRKNAERVNKYLFTDEAYNYSPYRIVVPEDQNAILSLADLHGKKVGVGASTLQAQILEEYNEQQNNAFEIVYGNDVANQIRAKRVDAFVIPEFAVPILNETADAGLKAVGDALVPVGGTAKDVGSYWPLRKEETDLKAKIDAAVVSIRDDGTLGKLSVEWLGKDYSNEYQND